MDFRKALKKLFKGKCLRRSSWDNPKTKKAHKTYIYRVAAMARMAVNTPKTTAEEFQQYLAMKTDEGKTSKTSDGSIVPWCPTQTDLFANDWEVFE